jgi:hypothetical protein
MLGLSARPQIATKPARTIRDLGWIFQRHLFDSGDGLGSSVGCNAPHFLFRYMRSRDDLYEPANILGHSNVRITDRYAKLAHCGAGNTHAKPRSHQVNDGAETGRRMTMCEFCTCAA